MSVQEGCVTMPDKRTPQEPKTTNKFIVTLPRAFGKARLEDAITYFIHGDGQYGSAARHFTIKTLRKKAR